MTQIQMLSARIARLETLVLSLPELRVTASELQAELGVLQSRVAEVDALIYEGERAERTLEHLGELAERVLIAGDAMVGAVPAPQPDPVEAPETAPQGPAATEVEVTPEPSAEMAPSPEDETEPETDVPAEATEEEGAEASRAEAPAGEQVPIEEDVSALTLDNLRAYLGAHPGSLPGGIAAHFRTTKFALGSLLGTLRRQGEADCLPTQPPHWYLMADLPHPNPQGQAGSAPATPLPELPPEPPQAAAPSPDVSDADLKVLVDCLQQRGNLTHRQVQAEFRYSQGWTMSHVEQVVAAGMAQGLLSAVGGSGRNSRIGLVRRSSGVAAAQAAPAGRA